MHQFRRRFRVRHYELDALERVNPVVYVQYMQEAAIEASTAAGFSPDWYHRQGTGWVVRRLTIRYGEALAYGDEVEVITWVSKMRGPRCFREYDLVRLSDGAQVVRARAEWVYMDRERERPTCFPEEQVPAFQPAGPLDPLEVRLATGTPTEGAFRYRSQRRVQLHELDNAQHVNHAVYLQWTGQACFEALRAAGYPLERMREQGWLTLQAAHDIEYLASAADNDPVEVVSWISQMGSDRTVWTHEIYHAGSGKLLARDCSLGILVTVQGQPCTPPGQVFSDVAHGSRDRSMPTS